MPLATTPLPVAEAKPEDAADGEDEEEDEDEVLNGWILAYEQFISPSVLC